MNWISRLLGGLVGDSKQPKPGNAVGLGRAEIPSPPPQDSSQRAVVSKPPRTVGTPFVIGLDLGTSSTKVVLRRLGDSVSWIAPSPAPTRDLAWFCTPTRMTESDDSLYFGGLATQKSSRIFEDIKLELLDSPSSVGEFREPERRAIAFLGWLLEHVADWITRQYSDQEPRCIVNIGIPVQYFGGSEQVLRHFRRYEQVVQAAIATTSWSGGPGIRQGIAGAMLRSAVDFGIQHRGAQIDSARVFPESLSTLHSLQRDPSSAPGIHTVVDIGSGTTEVASSLIATRDGKRMITCSSESSERHGVRALDIACASGAEALVSIQKGFWQQFVRTFERGRGNDAKNRNAHRAWKHTHVVFTGGGGLRPEIRDYFQASCKDHSPVQDVFRGEPTSLQARIYKPSAQVLKPIRGANTQAHDARHLLAVAHGLSFHAREWPDWFDPGRVPPVESDEYQPPPFDPQEAGYSGR